MVHVLRCRCYAAGFVFVAMVATASSARAQDAPKAWTVDSGVGLEIIQIKADRVADFEFLVGKIREALNKSEDATHKEVAASLKVFKGADAPAANAPVVFIAMIDPAAKGADYSIPGLISVVYKAFPEQQQEIFKKGVDGVFASGVNYLRLQPVP
jgi:hypothetical protein